MQVGLIWASNVWKSTLFNRLIWQFRAIVTDIHGTTQDILYHQTSLKDDLNDKSIKLIFADSPWLLSFDEERPFIKRLLNESDILFFVIDEKVGFTAKEQYIHEFIMQNNYKDKIVLLLNKVDKATNRDDEIIITSEYAKLWYENIIITSAKQGKNIWKLRSLIFEYAKKNNFFGQNLEKDIELIEKQEDESIENSDNTKKNPDKNIFNIAIVGKPNSWKSTLLNTIAGKYISKVQNKPWTTLDYVIYDTDFEWEKFRIYDTAGIRKKWKSHWLEAIAYEKTINMLKYLHPPVLFLIDWEVWLTHRDMTLLKEIHQIWVSLVIWINKMDILDKDTKKRIETFIQDHLPFLKYVTIIPLSAKTWKNIKKVIKSLKEAHKNSFTQIKTSKLNEVVHKSYISNPPRFPKNKICKILYLTQVSVNPCRFKVFINHKNRANFSFKRRLENVLRKNFWFEWNPIQLDFVERERRRLDKKFVNWIR